MLFHRLLPLALIVFLGYTIRVTSLAYQPLWKDEMEAIAYANVPLSQIISYFARPGWNGPLYHLVMHTWISIFGMSSFATRYLSLLAGVLLISILFALGTRCLSRAEGILACLLGTLSPYLVWYSQEAKMYAWLITLSSLSTYLLIVALEDKRRILWSIYSISLVCCCYLHVFGVLIIPVHLLLAIFLRNERHLPLMLTSLIVIVIAVLPALSWELDYFLLKTQTYFPPVNPLTILISTVSAFGLNRNESPILLGNALFFFILLCGVLLEQNSSVNPVHGDSRTVSQSRLSHPVFWASYLFLPMIILALICTRVPLFTDRYLSIAVPAFILLVASGLAKLYKVNRILGGVVIFLIVSLTITSLYYQSTNILK